LQAKRTALLTPRHQSLPAARCWAECRVLRASDANRSGCSVWSKTACAPAQPARRRGGSVLSHLIVCASSYLLHSDNARGSEANHD